LHTDFESGEVRGRLDGDIEKTVRHLLVRTPLLTQLRIAGTHNIKAETANPHAGINAADEKSVADLLSATGETGIAETGRAGMGNFEAEKWIAGSILRFTGSRSICCRHFRFCVTTWCMRYRTLQSVLIGWFSTQDFC
jgi:hypothetical protein